MEANPVGKAFVVAVEAAVVAFVAVVVMEAAKAA